jgi:pyruvate dehydrogenase E1 component beta subunit
VSGLVPEGDAPMPLDRARVLAAGDDITIVGISHMALECVRAGKVLATAGISAEIIDPVALAPLDVETIAASARRTGRLLVVDTGWLACGAAGEIVLRVLERLAGERAISIARMGYLPTPCPTTKPLENLFYPTAATIAARAADLIGVPLDPAACAAPPAHEIQEFRGPF